MAFTYLLFYKEKHGLLHSAPIATNDTVIAEGGVNKLTTKGSMQGLIVEQGDDMYKTVDTEGK